MNSIDKSSEIHLEEKNGNLHFKIHGRFGVDTAMELTARISRKYQTGRNVFIHTSEVTAVSPQSKAMFQSMLGVYNLPSKNVFLMGEKGKDICHDEGRVIIAQKPHGHKRCSGRCKNCKCESKQDH